MAIGGKVKENVNFVEQPKYVGLFEAKVIGVNPSAEEFEELLGWTPKEDSKQFEYLGESKDGNTSLRIDFWLEEIKTRNRDDMDVNEKFKVTFFIEDKQRENKDGTRMQYINKVGVCSWASDPNDLPDWFKEREYRVAYSGEEELYNFLRMWLSKLDYRDKEAVLELEWKKLMRGNVKEIKDQVNGEWCGNVVCLATITTTEKDGDVKEYQRVYNRGFLSPYSLKYFRTIDFSSEETLSRLKAKKPRDLKAHERFALDVTSTEYGCRDYYILKDLKLYNSEDNIASSDKVISDEGADY